MSTIKTTYIQHPDATSPAIELLADGTSNLPGVSTTGIPEGSNLYYTDARVDARVSALSLADEAYVENNTASDFASFASTIPITISQTTPNIITFDSTPMASPNMSWAFANFNGQLAPYNWLHSHTGYFQLSFWARTTNDVWHVMSVCKNGTYLQPVGTSVRMGSNGGSWGYATQLIYKVESTSTPYSLWSWSQTNSTAQSSFSGAPPVGFIAPAQDGASTNNGYFSMFNIVPLSRL